MRISNESYTKRLKVYNLEDNWIETKPVILNEIDKDLIVYRYMTSLTIYKGSNVVYFRKLESGVNYKQLLITLTTYGLISLAGLGYIVSLLLKEDDSSEVVIIPDTKEGNDIIDNIDNNIDPKPDGDSHKNNSKLQEVRCLDYLKEEESASNFDYETRDPWENNIPGPSNEKSLL